MDISNTIIQAIENATIQDDENDIKDKNDDNTPIKKIEERDCIELKNLEYKNVLMYGNNLKPRDESVTVSVLEDLLERESQMNRLDLWTKLDKTDKIIKLRAYTKVLTERHNLSPDEAKRLDNYFLQCLDRKYLLKIKEVAYSREKGVIENIPALIFNEEMRTFVLKKSDKHVNTLKSLGPKKNKTQKF